MKKLIILTWALLLFASPSLGAETENKIKIAVKEFPPFVFKDLRGFAIDMANIICEKYDLIPEFVFYDTVPDVLRAVKQNECDMNFSGLTITADREKSVDFSQPFFNSGLIVAVKSDPTSRSLDFFIHLLKVIGLSWLVFMIGLTIVAHMIWYIERTDKDPKSFPKQYTKGILDAYWWAVVTMTTVGYGDKCPKKLIGRIIASIWMIIGIIWFAAFTATLTSSLTIDKMEHGEIGGLADLYNRRVSVIKGTTSEEYLRYYNIKIVLAETLDGLIQNLKKRKVDAVVYDAPALMHLSKIDPSIKVVGEMFDKQNYGIAFPENRDNKYKEMFNIALLEMQESGEYKKIYDKWF